MRVHTIVHNLRGNLLGCLDFLKRYHDIFAEKNRKKKIIFYLDFCQIDQNFKDQKLFWTKN